MHVCDAEHVPAPVGRRQILRQLNAVPSSVVHSVFAAHSVSSPFEPTLHVVPPPAAVPCVPVPAFWQSEMSTLLPMCVALKIEHFIPVGHTAGFALFAGSQFDEHAGGMPGITVPPLWMSITH